MRWASIAARIASTGPRAFLIASPPGTTSGGATSSSRSACARQYASASPRSRAARREPVVEDDEHPGGSVDGVAERRVARIQDPMREAHRVAEPDDDLLHDVAHRHRPSFAPTQLQRLVDRLGGQDVIDHHARGPDDAGAVAQLARHDPKIASGEHERATEDPLPRAREQFRLCLGNIAAEDDDRRVEEVHGAGEHLSQRSARLAHHARRGGVAVPDEADDVAAVRAGRPLRRQPLGQRLTAGHGLQAADVPASAHDVVERRPDVADVPGRAECAAMDPPTRDDAAPDPGPDLDEQQVFGVAPMNPVLAAGHEVDVVVDQDGVVVGCR